MSTLTAQAVLARTDCDYAACYCEENAWRLARRLADTGIVRLQDLSVVILSNPAKQVYLWRQRASSAPPSEQGLVVWDYHVFVISSPSMSGSSAQKVFTGRQRALVWDIDTTLDFPCTAEEYVQDALKLYAFPLDHPKLARYFRVVPAEMYLKHFASDRSHMLKPGRSIHAATAADWMAPPPPWPCIVAEDGSTHTLPVLWDMRAGSTWSPGAAAALTSQWSDRSDGEGDDGIGDSGSSGSSHGDSDDGRNGDEVDGRRSTGQHHKEPQQRQQLHQHLVSSAAPEASGSQQGQHAGGPPGSGGREHGQGAEGQGSRTHDTRWGCVHDEVSFVRDVLHIALRS